MQQMRPHGGRCHEGCVITAPPCCSCVHCTRLAAAALSASPPCAAWAPVTNRPPNNGSHSANRRHMSTPDPLPAHPSSAFSEPVEPPAMANGAQQRMRHQQHAACTLHAWHGPCAAAAPPLCCAAAAAPMPAQPALARMSCLLAAHPDTIGCRVLKLIAKVLLMLVLVRSLLSSAEVPWRHGAALTQ